VPSSAVPWAADAVQVLALLQVQSWEAITNGAIGTIIIIGATVIAGSEPQAEDRIRYRADIAADERSQVMVFRGSTTRSSSN